MRRRADGEEWKRCFVCLCWKWPCGGQGWDGLDQGGVVCVGGVLEVRMTAVVQKVVLQLVVVLGSLLWRRHDQRPKRKGWWVEEYWWVGCE